jgi:hypothetical protein
MKLSRINTIAVLVIAFLVLLSVVWGRTAKAIEHPYSIQNPGAEPPATSKKGGPDAPLCGPNDPDVPACNWPDFNPWDAFAINLRTDGPITVAAAFAPLLPLRRTRRKVEQEKAQRAAELAQDRAEETPELIPMSTIQPARPMRRRTDYEHKAA